MKMVFDGNFFLISSHPDAGAKARIAGFSFDRTKRLYYTPLPHVAARLREYADESAKKEITRRCIVVTPWPGRIPFPKGKTPLPFQVPAALWALERNRSYLAIDPGLGKTIIMALIINALDGTPVVVITPPSLTLNAKIKIEDWATRHGLRILIYDRKHDTTADGQRADVLIVPDSVIHKKQCKREIARTVCLEGGTLQVDESHRFKHSNARRTTALLGRGGRGGLVGLFERVALLSGTPVQNRFMELFAPVSRLAPDAIGNMKRFDYGVRYCGGHIDEESGHWKFDGSTNGDELRERLQKNFMLRIKKDALTGLPPKTEELVFVAEDLPPKITAVERKMLAEHSPQELTAHLNPTGHVSTYRRMLGVAKAPLAIRYIEDVMEDTGQAFLVFAIHKEVVRLLAKGLQRFKPLVIDGDVKPGAPRQAVAELFQRSPDHLALIGNVEIMEGFDLTKAHEVFAVESSWVPGKNDQAIDRAHRHGQKFAVAVHHIVFKNSFDRKVIESNLRKRKSINLI